MRVQSTSQSPDNQIIRLPDSRAPAAIGRVARLELSFEPRRGRTVLAHAYAEPPFRIGRAFELDDAAYVIIACTGAGIFAGDSLRQSVRVAPGARVVLTSQSALQVHPGALPSSLPAVLTSNLPAVVPSNFPAVLPSRLPALLHHDYVVDDDGELQCHWDPVIPFAGARLAQRFDLRIGDASRLYWSDALMAGRVSRGEAWQFESLAHELSLRIGGSLAYLERYTLTPSDRRVAHPWLAGSARYFATAVAHHERATAETAEALHHAGAPPAGSPHRVQLAADLVRPRTIVARILATDGVPFAAARARCHGAALASIFGAPGQVARK
jgi:urease accessory protein UreH